MSEVISSFRSLRAGSQVFALLMLFLCVILHTMSSGKSLQLLCILPFGMLCLSAISMMFVKKKKKKALILPSINEFLSPAKDQHGFRPRHSTTSALLQLTTDIETGFNQRKPPHRTVCVAIDLTAAFDTVSHDTLISKIVGSSLPPAITRWLSCYLRGRQAATSFRGTKSSTRIVRTGVPQGSKLSPSLFNYYIADMPRPTPPSRGFATLTTSQSGQLDQRFRSWSP